MNPLTYSILNVLFGAIAVMVTIGALRELRK